MSVARFNQPEGMSMEDLKPCPFCGSKNIDESFARGFEGGDEKIPVIGAGCMDCGACGPMVKFPRNTTGYQESSEAWNSQQLQTEVQRLKAESWVSVEERLPEGDTPCLVWIAERQSAICCMYLKDCKDFSLVKCDSEKGFMEHGVTHWKPLSPPNSDKD